MDKSLKKKYQALVANIAKYDNALIAFSGGVDSSLVAFVAGQTLGKKSLAVTSASASLKRADLELSEQLAEAWGIRHRVIVTKELSKREYTSNPTNRCFYCKTSLYEELAVISKNEGFEVTLNGTNVDDLGDYRPGLEAAKNFKVASPLVECGFSKTDIRSLASSLGLSNAQKPQAACLSSRFPYGTEITVELLRRVEAAEEVLQNQGFTQFRVRHHGDLARLEILTLEFPKMFQDFTEVEKEIKAAGYKHVTLDLAGFRSGSLNEGLNLNMIDIKDVTHS